MGITRAGKAEKEQIGKSCRNSTEKFGGEEHPPAPDSLIVEG